jgi:hypothetical protein
VVEIRSTGSLGAWRGQRHAAAALNNGGGVANAWRTRRHFIEHVAGIRQLDLEVVLWHIPSIS